MEGYKAAGKLKGKVALVTGGDSGIGRATCIAFAKEGAHVAFIYYDEDKDAKETQKRIEAEGVKALALKGDLKQKDFCNEAVKKVVSELGGLNIVVNNAAVQFVQKNVEDIPEDQLRTTFETNVFGAFFITQAAMPHLKEGDSIINTTSVTAFRGNPDLLDYSATKGALLAFTRALSENLAKKKIRVNSVAPGPIWTALIPSSFGKDHVKKFGTDTPMGRAGQPDEVAPCFVFLASDDASYITGQTLHPNGGILIGA